MSGTLWQRRRKAAREAGAYHADGGPDTRAHHASLGSDCAEAYDDAFADRRRDRENEIARHNHPLRQLVNEADALAFSAESEEVTHLARLVERLAQYMLDKEEQA